VLKLRPGSSGRLKRVLGSRSWSLAPQVALDERPRSYILAVVGPRRSQFAKLLRCDDPERAVPLGADARQTWTASVKAETRVDALGSAKGLRAPRTLDALSGKSAYESLLL
jgi:hypothetical protein